MPDVTSALPLASALRGIKEDAGNCLQAEARKNPVERRCSFTLCTRQPCPREREEAASSSSASSGDLTSASSYAEDRRRSESFRAWCRARTLWPGMRVRLASPTLLKVYSWPSPSEHAIMSFLISKEDLVRQLVVGRNLTAAHTSDELRRLFPEERGASVASVRRFCSSHNIRRILTPLQRDVAMHCKMCGRARTFLWSQNAEGGVDLVA